MQYTGATIESVGRQPVDLFALGPRVIDVCVWLCLWVTTLDISHACIRRDDTETGAAQTH